MKEIRDFLYNNYWIIYGRIRLYIRRMTTRYVYVVQSQFTNIETFSVRVFDIYNNPKKAITRAKKEIAEMDNWVRGIPIPLEFYRKHIDELDDNYSILYGYTMDDIEKGIVEMGLPKHPLIRYLWKDYLGYTAEEWQNSHLQYSMCCRTERVTVSVEKRAVNRRKWFSIVFEEIVEPI